MSNRFTLQYWKDGGWFVGKLREVPNVFSQGKTLEELVENIEDAYALMVKESEESIPKKRYKSREVALAG